MRKRLSRFFTVAVALVLVLSATPATGGAADSRSPRNMTTVFTTEYTKPEVKVIVPSTGAVFINPYESSVQIGNEEEAGQIISVPSSIANLSRMPLQVDVTVSATILEGSDMRLSSTSTKETESRIKKAFMYFEIKNVSTALAEAPESVRWDGNYSEDTSIIVSAIANRSRKNMVTLAAASRDGEVTNNGSAAFHLGGDAVKNPKTPWNEKDGVKVAVSFSFKPLPYS